MYKIPNTIVLLTIGLQQKTILLVQKFEYSGIFEIYMDREYHGQVQRAGNGWTVNIIPESPITKEHYQSLVDAINLQLQ